LGEKTISNDYFHFHNSLNSYESLAQINVRDNRFLPSDEILFVIWMKIRKNDDKKGRNKGFTLFFENSFFIHQKIEINR
jgi:hypothetical protein